MAKSAQQVRTDSQFPRGTQEPSQAGRTIQTLNWTKLHLKYQLKYQLNNQKNNQLNNQLNSQLISQLNSQLNCQLNCQLNSLTQLSAEPVTLETIKITS